MLHHIIHRHVKAHFEKHYRAKFQAKAHLVLVIDSILVLAALSLLGVGVYFKFFYHPLRDDFRISAFIEDSPKSGGPAVVVVRMINDGQHALHNAVLTVHLPSVFRPTGYPNGYDAATRQVDVGYLSPKQSAEYRFEGLLIGPPGSAHTYAHLVATSDEGEHDEKLVVGTIEWKESLIEASIEMQSPVVPNQPARVSVILKNGSKLDFNDVQLVPAWPEGLRVTVATPPVSRGVVRLGRIEAGEEVRADFVIVNPKSEPTSAPISFEAVWIDKTSRTTIAAASGAMEMIDARLELTAAPKDKAPVKAGSEVPFIVRYANRGTLTLKNVRFSLTFDPRIAERASKPLVKTVEQIAPGETGEFEVNARVLKTLSPYINDPQLVPKPEAIFDYLAPKGINLQTAGTGTGVKVGGQASVYATARYFTAEGEQLGRGPLPPQVGKATRYWLFVSAQNGPTELTNAQVTVRLPPSVEWTGRYAVSAGDDPQASGSLITWNLGSVPRHTGSESPVPTLSFEVALTPTANQVGQPALLLLQAGLTGTDAWTGLPVEDSAPSLTTDLSDDAYIKGRTKVR